MDAALLKSMLLEPILHHDSYNTTGPLSLCLLQAKFVT